MMHMTIQTQMTLQRNGQKNLEMVIMMMDTMMPMIIGKMKWTKSIGTIEKF